jgi:hypothetical protein
MCILLTAAAAHTAGNVRPESGAALARFFSCALSISQPRVRHGRTAGEKRNFTPEGETMKTTLLLFSAFLAAESAQNGTAKNRCPRRAQDSGM